MPLSKISSNWRNFWKWHWIFSLGRWHWFLAISKFSLGKKVNAKKVISRKKVFCITKFIPLVYLVNHVEIINLFNICAFICINKALDLVPFLHNRTYIYHLLSCNSMSYLPIHPLSKKAARSDKNKNICFGSNCALSKQNKCTSSFTKRWDNFVNWCVFGISMFLLHFANLKT